MPIHIKIPFLCLSVCLFLFLFLFYRKAEILRVSERDHSTKAPFHMVQGGLEPGLHECQTSTLFREVIHHTHTHFWFFF